MTEFVTEFYGSSDDCVEVEGVPNASGPHSASDGYEFYSSPGSHGTESLMLKMTSGDECMYIFACYYGSWSFAIFSSADDYDSFPGWPIDRKFGDKIAYSETLRITTQHEVTVSVVH